MTLAVPALVVSIVSVCISIASIVYVTILHRRTERKTEEQLSFITHLVANSAADPDTVRRMLQDYAKAGEWRAKVSRRPDGTYGLEYVVVM